MFLEKYSKEHGYGDTTATGLSKLLRGTNLRRSEILLRETLQNSWDARLPGTVPDYWLALKPAAESVRKTLADRVFTGLEDPGLKHLKNALTSPHLHLLEIHDRGTVGLNGPTDPRKARKDNNNNFTSLVFDIGSTKSSLAAGGTYGFGKTATFNASNTGAVVYWSATISPSGQYEHRLIASALTEDYAFAGKRFTGTHWWGHSLGADHIEPITGTVAKQLGEAIFGEYFEDGETGTSILVIDPVVRVSQVSIDSENDEDDEESISEDVAVSTPAHMQELGKQLEESIINNAWPKIMPNTTSQREMGIALQVGSRNYDLKRTVKARKTPFIYALSELRKLQDPQDQLPENKQVQLSLIPKEIDHKEIRLRKSGILNDLDIVQGGTATVGDLFLISTFEQSSRERADDSFTNSVCYMRNATEIVVKHTEPIAAPDSYVNWYGVFKPRKEFDKYFSQSEPPTHNDWNHESAQDPVASEIVRRALNNIYRNIRQFVTGLEPRKSTSEISTRKLSEDLGMFVPGLGSSPLSMAPTKKSSNRSSTRSTKKQTASATILDSRELPSNDPLERLQRADFQVQSANQTERIYVTVDAKSFDGSQKLRHDEYSVQLLHGSQPIGEGPEAVEVDVGTTYTLLVSVPASAQIDLGIQVAPRD